QPSRGHLTRSDIDCIVSWLESPANFASIYGASGRTSIGKPLRNSTRGYEELARKLNTKSKGRLILSPKAVRERFNRCRANYVKVKAESETTGFGISETDRKKDINTIHQKLESMCPCYERMDALFGHRPNVKPEATYNEVTIAKNETSEAVEDVPSKDHEQRAIDKEATVVTEHDRIDYCHDPGTNGDENNDNNDDNDGGDNDDDFGTDAANVNTIPRSSTAIVRNKAGRKD
ncbi:hypothetical protein BGZ50_001025, partial [Haplosporangium sp. Z 11]